VAADESTPVPTTALIFQFYRTLQAQGLGGEGNHGGDHDHGGGGTHGGDHDRGGEGGHD